MISDEKWQALKLSMQELGIFDKDLDESFVRGHGRGGQKKQKSSNAVILTHLPTGIRIRVEKSRSQADNRFFARRLLCEKIREQIHGVKTKQQSLIEKKAKQKKRRQRRSKKDATPE